MTIDTTSTSGYQPDLSVKIAGVNFKNPIITASGTFGFGREFEQYININKLGGICSKGLTLNPKDGNAGIRIHEITGGMMNSIGLQNPGVQAFIDSELGFMKKFDTVVIANLGGNTEDDYLRGMELLNDTEIDILELNISCPNVKSGGMSFGIDSCVAFDIVSKVRAICKKPLMVKLSPNAQSIKDMALRCEAAGADAISMVNTFSGMAIDIKAKKPVFNNVIAGVSGPCIKPIALRMVYEVCKVVKIPVVGIGGIMNARDVIEFIMAGASAVQIGSGNLVNPSISIEILEDLEKYMRDNNIKSLDEIRGII